MRGRMAICQGLQEESREPFEPLWERKAARNRDPWIIHLNIALYMVVSLYFGGKSHVSTGQKVS